MSTCTTFSICILLSVVVPPQCLLLAMIVIAAATTAHQGYVDLMIFIELLLVNDIGAEIAW